jgi:hypothetical protein
VLELHYLSPTASANVTNGNSFPSYIPRFRLVILDRATHAILWSVSEFPQLNVRKKTFEQECDAAVSQLLEDLKAISAGQFPSVAAAGSNKINK